MHSMSSQVREAAASTLVTIYLLERDYKQTHVVTYHPTSNRFPLSIGTGRLQIHLQSTTFLNRYYVQP